MTRPWSTILAEARYYVPADEGALLARTTQKYRGVSKLGLRTGKVRMMSMYGLKPTPIADRLVMALYEMHLDRQTEHSHDIGHHTI